MIEIGKMIIELFAAAQQGDAAVVKSILHDYSGYKVDYVNAALLIAIDKNHHSVINELLTPYGFSAGIIPECHDNAPIKLALANNNKEFVLKLMQHIKIRTLKMLENSEMLQLYEIILDNFADKQLSAYDFVLVRDIMADGTPAYFNKRIDECVSILVGELKRRKIYSSLTQVKAKNIPCSRLQPR